MFDGYKDEDVVENISDRVNEYSYSEKSIISIDSLLNNEIINENLIQDENIVNNASSELRNILLFYIIDDNIYQIIIKENDSLSNLITKDKYNKIMAAFEAFFSNNDENIINNNYSYIIDTLEACANIEKVPDHINRYIISSVDIDRIKNILFKYKIPTNVDINYIISNFVKEEFMNYYDSTNIINEIIMKERTLIYLLTNYIEYNINNYNDYECDVCEIFNTLFLYSGCEHFIPIMCIGLIENTILNDYDAETEPDLNNVESVAYHMMGFIITEGIDYSSRICDILYKIIQIVKKHGLLNDILNEFYNLVYFGEMLLNIYTYINYNNIIEFDIIDNEIYSKENYVNVITDTVIDNCYFFDKCTEDVNKCLIFIYLYYNYNNVSLSLESIIECNKLGSTLGFKPDYNLISTYIMKSFIKTNNGYNKYMLDNNFLLLNDIESDPQNYCNTVFNIIENIENEYIMYDEFDKAREYDYLYNLSRLCYLLVFYINYFTIEIEIDDIIDINTILNKFISIIYELYNHDDKTIYEITLSNIEYLYNVIDDIDQFIKVVIIYNNYIEYIKSNFNSIEIKPVSDLETYLSFMNDVFFNKSLGENEYIMNDVYDEVYGVRYDEYDSRFEMLRRIKNYVYLYNSKDD